MSMSEEWGRSGEDGGGEGGRAVGGERRHTIGIKIT